MTSKKASKMTIPKSFPAFRIHNDDTGYRAGIESISLDDLDPGEVVIKTAWSSVNFKDALAGTGQGKILRKFPLVGGIDVAGHVLASTDKAFKEGDAVLVTGSGLSETRDGGYAQYARLQSEWVIALPSGLSLRESMILGTAGFTAALALYRMLDNRQTPELGPLAVTGATLSALGTATGTAGTAGVDGVRHSHQPAPASPAATTHPASSQARPRAALALAAGRPVTGVAGVCRSGTLPRPRSAWARRRASRM